MMMMIGVQDQLRLGGLRSVAQIFSPLLARNQVVSGFARILNDFIARKWIFEKFLLGLQPPPASYV